QTLAKLLGPYVSADVRPEIVPILSGFLQSFYPLEVLASVGIKPGTFHGDFDTNRRQPMPEIGRIHGTLASQKQYSKARLRSRRIHVATGNMIGQGLRRVAGDIASNKKRISLFYPSNIPEYMHVPQDYFRFFEAARDL